MDLKKAIPYLTVVGLLAAGVLWLFSHFTPLPIHEALADRVEQNEVRQYVRSLQSELYFHYDQLRKYPFDPQIKRKIQQLEEEIKALRKDE